MVPSEQSQRLARVAQAFAVALFLYYAVLILVHGTPPLLGDFSRWIYLSELLARRMHGQADPAHFLFHYPIPNSTHTIVLGLLSAVMPWSLAARLYLVLSLAFCLVSVQVLARAAGTSPLIWFIAPGAFFLSVNFWYGFVAFQFAIALLFLYTAALLRRVEPGTSGHLPDWPVGLLLVLLFFTHMVPFTFALLLLFFFVRQTGRAALLWQVVVPALLTAWYVAGRIATVHLAGSATTTTAPRLFDLSFWLYKGNTFAKSFGFVNPFNGRSAALMLEGAPLFLFLFAVNAVICAAVLIVFVRNIQPGSPLRQASFVWLASVAAIPAYLIAPRDFLAISDPGSRILQTVVWLALFLCLRQGIGSSLPARVAAGGSVLLALSGVGLFWVVPWTVDVGATRTLPTPIEFLANAPNNYAVWSLDGLRQHRYDDVVFPTSLLGNRVDAPPATAH